MVDDNWNWAGVSSVCVSFYFRKSHLKKTEALLLHQVLVTFAIRGGVSLGVVESVTRVEIL